MLCLFIRSSLWLALLWRKAITTARHLCSGLCCHCLSDHHFDCLYCEGKPMITSRTSLNWAVLYLFIGLSFWLSSLCRENHDYLYCLFVQSSLWLCGQCEGKPYSYKSDIFTAFICLIISLTVWSVWREIVQLQVGHLYCVYLPDHLFGCVVSAKGNHTATSRTSGRWAASSTRWRACKRRLKEPTCQP